MHGGMKFTPVSMTNEDAQFLQSRQFSIREIARWFRLPPHMLADLQDSSVRANIEQQAIEFIVYSMRPWLVRWQQTLNRKLLSSDERKKMYFEFLLDALLQGDANSRFDSYMKGRQWGWLSINDIRRKENMPLVEGGDVYLQPMNMDEVGAEEEEVVAVPPQQPPPFQQEPGRNGDGNEEGVPESLRVELQKNFAESLNAIVTSGQHLRAELCEGHGRLGTRPGAG